MVIVPLRRHADRIGQELCAARAGNEKGSQSSACAQSCAVIAQCLEMYYFGGQGSGKRAKKGLRKKVRKKVPPTSKKGAKKGATHFEKRCHPLRNQSNGRPRIPLPSCDKINTMWLKVLSVFGLGMVGLWEGIPAGFALRLHPLLIGLISAAGTSVATLIVLFLGDRIRTRLLSKPLSENKGVPRDRLIDRVWRRYGVIGLGLLAPGLIGAPIGVALGLSLGVMARQLLFWIFAGIMLWTVGLTLAGMLGTAGVMHLLHR